ncbi:NERD domain-containing protein [Mesobacillus subterraneus]|uniref:NERD domain-containing protein n=1 Tax=Mesobacillus subterraneus TaxID=285983 RepID=UPI001CFE9216|nr:NERD domain-containing protein [Mesobacillus subterraneus]
MESYFFLVLMLIVIWFLDRNFAMIKGWIGEKRVSNILSSLDPQDYTLMNDLYLPKENGQTTQIDHLLISPKGIFVIETKNYKGWITGSEHSQYWTQTNYKRKDKLYNPIWQNSGHIKALQSILGDAASEIPIHSVIVFGKEATLKFKEPFKNAYVIKSSNVLQTINTIQTSQEVSLFKRGKVKQLLTPFIITDIKQKREIKKKHVSDLKSELEQKKTLVAENTCPRCGSPLVSRTGKKGKFKGCSSFPKCRFIA